MINNTITLAKRQLERHAKLGTASKLSVFEVASLMDTINQMHDMKQPSTKSIFFEFSLN